MRARSASRPSSPSSRAARARCAAKGVAASSSALRRRSASSRCNVCAGSTPHCRSASTSCARTRASLCEKASRRYALLRSPQRVARARAAAVRTESSASRSSGEIASGASSRGTAASAAAVSARTAGDPSRTALDSAAQASSPPDLPSVRTASARCFALGELSRAKASSRRLLSHPSRIKHAAAARTARGPKPEARGHPQRSRGPKPGARCHAQRSAVISSAARGACALPAAAGRGRACAPAASRGGCARWLRLSCRPVL